MKKYEIQRTNSEIQWKAMDINEKSTKIDANLWKSMEINANPWKSMKIYEKQRNSMKSNGNLWISIQIYGIQWKSIEINKVCKIYTAAAAKAPAQIEQPHKYNTYK